MLGLRSIFPTSLVNVVLSFVFFYKDDEQGCQNVKVHRKKTAKVSVNISRKRSHERQLNRTSDPPSLVVQPISWRIWSRTQSEVTPLIQRYVGAVGICFALSFSTLGSPTNVEATSINDTSINNLPLFLLNANVLCASFQRELPSNDPSKSVTEQFGACASGWRTSSNDQRPRWHLNGNPTQQTAVLCSQFSSQL